MSSDGIPPSQGDQDMGKSRVQMLRAERKAAATTAAQLAALATMPVAELAEKYREVFGAPSRTRNKEYLRKRLAWKIQERAEGGLSDLALRRIEELAPLAPVRWRQPVARKDSKDVPVVTAVTTTTRDSRLPPVGTVITRVHKEKKYEVKVLADGFEYQGHRFRSLSKIARVITGTAWNGYGFFGLSKERTE
jgi:hypothetical protein